MSYHLFSMQPMKLHKSIISALSVLLFLGVNLKLHAYNFSNESLNYKVMYKWGLVHKQAGHATLTLKKNGGEYNTILTAASEKWADKFYKVRDTLTGVVTANSFKPVIYQKISNEGGERKHDVVKYSYSGKDVTGKCTRKKWDKKGTLKVNDSRTLSATGTTIDMLSSFYYMRALPYESWKSGHTTSVNLFSGKRKEILTIKYLGLTTLKLDDKEHRCYHISFNFTDPSKPGKETSDSMEAWIAADARRIPLKLEGKLPVGKVHCLYIGG